MNRRAFLTVTGTASITVLAGCSSGRQFHEVNGQTVPLIPVDEAHEWYQNEAANFVDTRGQHHYQTSHIPGAVWSPAPSGRSPDDPVEEWPTDTTIVTYCDCPTTMAAQRASSLMSAGYTDVYAFQHSYGGDWVEREYPVEWGTGFRSYTEHELRGQADPSHAGEQVWLQTIDSDQRYVATIEADGTYEASFSFYDVTDDTLLEIDAPEYTVEATLGEIADSTITAQHA